MNWSNPTGQTDETAAADGLDGDRPTEVSIDENTPLERSPGRSNDGRFAPNRPERLDRAGAETPAEGGARHGPSPDVEDGPSPAGGRRTLVVGDDPSEIRSVAAVIDSEVVGRVRVRADGDADGSTATADDPAELEAALRGDEIDLVALAFTAPSRAGFYRMLRVCRRHGVRAIVPNDRADDVLSATEQADGTVEVELEPWSRRTRTAKRAFDLAFSIAGLLVLPPLCLLIAAAIRLEDGGPVFYKQRRTTLLGRPFEVYKFRTMVTDAESETGATQSVEDIGEVDPRVTRVGRVLRRTHLDEIPQLWSIFAGEMSVVGPRPERPELESERNREAPGWRCRWFVRPGLTGLAQISGVTSYQPATKLRYDLEYVDRQSLLLDARIVLRQIGAVLDGALGLLERSQ